MKTSNTNEFGKALRDRRKTLGYTQAYLAEVSGFSVSFISDLERGKKTIELGKAIEMSKLLGLDVCLQARDGNVES